MNSDPSASLRWTVYSLLTTVAVAAVCGRILSTAHGREAHLSWPKEKPEPTPTLGGNDRSRWATVRALADQGTYVIGRRDPSKATSENPYGNTGIVFEPGAAWGTLDMVLHPERNEFYSSKPPLLPTLLAGEYWVLKRAFGWSLEDPVAGRFTVIRTILLTVNALPFLIYLLLLARLCELLGTTDWGRLYVFAAGCFGTYLTTFAVTLNNHSVGTTSAMVALYPAVLILLERSRSGWLFLLSGFFAGFTVTNELPAAAFAVGLFALLLWRAPRPTLLGFLPAALIPLVALALLNHHVFGQVMPVYEKVDTVWYKYEGSYWNRPPEQQTGIDWAGTKEGRLTYAFHFLLGHHGVFLLSPVFLLALGGIAISVGNSQKAVGSQKATGLPTAFCLLPTAFRLALLTAFLTVVVIGFYLYKTTNYGGWTSGPRWLMWLTPFWLLCLLPAADWLGGRRWGRGLALAALAVSVLSVSYPAWNPWRHPWAYNLLEAQRWIAY